MPCLRKNKNLTEMTNIIQGFKQITVMTNKSAIIHVDNTIIYMI